MTIWSLLIREILHRKLSFALAVLSVVVASGSLIGSIALLRLHDVRTDQILEQKEAELQQSTAQLNDETRKAMLKLGFNIVILPKDQNLSDWYSEDYASKYMPEKYVEQLAGSGIVTVRHLLPSLQQKVDWPERKRKIILVGARDEVPNLHKSPVKPIVEPVPKGTISLGYELHRSMDITVGDKVTLMGREFTVHACHEEQGRMLIEKEKRDRETLRSVRERLASILTPVVVTACAVWIAVLGLTNVRARREEIGILRTIGIRSRDILVMFMSRHVLVGALGGAIGFAAGLLSADYFSAVREGTRIKLTDMGLSWVGLFVLSVVGAAALAVMACWIPTIIAT